MNLTQYFHFTDQVSGRNFFFIIARVCKNNDVVRSGTVEPANYPRLLFLRLLFLQEKSCTSKNFYRLPLIKTVWTMQGQVGRYTQQSEDPIIQQKKYCLQQSHTNSLTIGITNTATS